MDEKTEITLMSGAESRFASQEALRTHFPSEMIQANHTVLYDTRSPVLDDEGVIVYPGALLSEDETGQPIAIACFVDVPQNGQPPFVNPRRWAAKPLPLFTGSE